MYWISGLLAVVSLYLTFHGLNLMYDNSYENQVVGGDAYNFIIYATRGTAFVCAGIVFSVLSAISALVADKVSAALAPLRLPAVAEANSAVDKG